MTPVLKHVCIDKLDDLVKNTTIHTKPQLK